MRYLTPEAKSLVLADWERRQREAPVTDVTPGCPGGRGGIDAPMIEACAVLNALPGVVTLQSCAGHIYPNRDGSNHIYPGAVWLWLAADVAAAAYRDAWSSSERSTSSSSRASSGSPTVRKFSTSDGRQRLTRWRRATRSQRGWRVPHEPI